MIPVLCKVRSPSGLPLSGAHIILEYAGAKWEAFTSEDGLAETWFLRDSRPRRQNANPQLVQLTIEASELPWKSSYREILLTYEARHLLVFQLGFLGNDLFRHFSMPLSKSVSSLLSLEQVREIKENLLGGTKTSLELPAEPPEKAAIRSNGFEFPLPNNTSLFGKPAAPSRPSLFDPLPPSPTPWFREPAPKAGELGTHGSQNRVFTLDAPDTFPIQGTTAAFATDQSVTQVFSRTLPPSAAHPAMGRATPIRKRAKRKRSLAQTMSLSHKFIRRDAIEIFVETWEATLAAWTSLLDKTTLPTDVSISARNLTTAVNALESVIANKEGTGLLARFGYVQLSNWFDLLENRIQQDRQKGLILPASGRGNASIAMDIYIHAQEVASNSPFSRGQLQERKRIGGRWKELAGPSALLLLVYSDIAETFVYIPV